MQSGTHLIRLVGRDIVARINGCAKVRCGGIPRADRFCEVGFSPLTHCWREARLSFPMW